MPLKLVSHHQKCCGYDQRKLIDAMTDNAKLDKTLDAPTFASTMGQAVWLMTMSKANRDLPISHIEKLIAPAILFKQFRLFSKGKQPVAFLVWASVSDEVKVRIEEDQAVPSLDEWRSGSNVLVVDCISPFNPSATFTNKFYADLVQSAKKTN